jgi:hypothetical protein
MKDWFKTQIAFFKEVLVDLICDDYGLTKEKPSGDAGKYFTVIPNKVLDQLDRIERKEAAHLLRRLELLGREEYPGKRFQVILRDKGGRFRQMPRPQVEQETFIKDQER